MNYARFRFPVDHAEAPVGAHHRWTWVGDIVSQAGVVFRDIDIAVDMEREPAGWAIDSIEVTTAETDRPLTAPDADAPAEWSALDRAIFDEARKIIAARWDEIEADAEDSNT